MNPQKFTQKSLEAIQGAQSAVTEYGNAQMEQEHLLYAMLEDENGLISQLMKKMNQEPERVKQAAI